MIQGSQESRRQLLGIVRVNRCDQTACQKLLDMLGKHVYLHNGRGSPPPPAMAALAFRGGVVLGGHGRSVHSPRVVLPLETEVGVVTAFVQRPAVTWNRGLIEAYELSALGTKGGLAVDGLDGLTLFEVEVESGQLVSSSSRVTASPASLVSGKRLRPGR